MTLLQNIISGAQSLLVLMGSNFLIKMNRLQNIKINRTTLDSLVNLSNILIPSTSGDIVIYSGLKILQNPRFLMKR